MPDVSAPPPPGHPPAHEIHLLDYIGVVLKRLPVAVGVLVATVALGLAYSFTRAPEFRAVSRILIEPTAVDLTSVKAAYDPEAGGARSNDYLPTQMRLITSLPVMEETLKRAGLLETEEFGQAPDPAALLATQVIAQQVRGARLVDVTCLRRDRAQAARIVNETVDAYIQSNRQRRLGVSADGLEELRKKAEELRLKLEHATTEMQTFLSANGIVSFEQAIRNLEDRVRGLNESLWRTEPIRLKLKAEVDTAQGSLAAGRSIENMPSVVANPAVTQLTIEYVKMGITEAEMRNRLGENHPQVQNYGVQREAMRTQIALVAASVLGSLRVEHDQAQLEAGLLRDALKETEREIETINELGVQHQLLLRARTAAQESYQQILQRIEEINLNQLGVQGENVFVVFRATPPQIKAYPSHSRHLLLSGLLGLVLSIGVCFFLDYMDRSVKTPEEAQRLFHAPLLGTVPAPEAGVAPGGDFHAVDHPRSQLAESFRIVRSAVRQQCPDGDPRSLVVTSALPEEGKSMVSINIALAAAQAGSRVLLVDADLRKPRLHAAFGVPNDIGLADLLRAETLPAALPVQVGRVPNLSLLTSGKPPPNPAELLDSRAFREFLRRAREQYDLVIFDAPPGLNLIDPMLLARQVDGLIAVVRLLATPQGAVRYFADRLAASGTRVLGLVTNHIDVPALGRFSSYYYGSYGRYGLYYGAETREKS
jgi:capsular exopolysaccharide synthesis family protein